MTDAISDALNADVENVKPSKTPRYGQVGTTGLKQYGGLVDEEFLKELRGPKGAKVFREMADNDPIVGAVLFAFSMLLRNVDWNWQAADESDEAENAKEFAESVFTDMDNTMPDVIDEVSSMFDYGFAPMEIVWKIRNGDDGTEDDGKIGIKAISLRAQPTVNRWLIDTATSAILGLFQQPLSGPEVFIPIEKMLLFRTTVRRNNPEGRSILRTAYRSWYFKKRVEEIEGVGIERDLAGLPVARIPGEYFDADADDDQKAVLQSWQKMITNLKRDKQEGVLIPSDRDQSGHPMFDIELMHSGSSRQIDTTKIIDRFDRAIATSVLADFIFLGQNSVGSFALSSDKTALFANAIGGFLKSICAVFNRDLMPRLWKYNNFDPETMPKLQHGDIEHVNLTELSALLTSLTGAGAPLFPDRDLENYIRDQAGLPPMPDEGTEMTTPVPGMPGQTVTVDPRLAARTAATRMGSMAATAAAPDAGGGDVNAKQAAAPKDNLAPQGEGKD